MAKDYKNVFINEDLTEEQADLFFLGRTAKKQGLIKTAWTMNGATFISKIVNGEKEMQEVSSKEHLKLLLPKLKMPKSKPTKDNKKPTSSWSTQEHQPEARASTNNESQVSAREDPPINADAADQGSAEEGEVSS